MVRGALVLMVASSALSIAGAADAQTFEQENKTVATRAHGGALPFATLTEMWAFGRRWSVNGLYAVRSGPPSGETRHWVIRNAWGNLAGQGGVRWADSRTCPALVSALNDLEGLGIARPEVPGLGPLVAPPPVDGANLTYAQRYGSDDGGAPVAFEVTGNVGTQLGRWWGDAERSLRDCWLNAEPAP